MALAFISVVLFQWFRCWCPSQRYKRSTTGGKKGKPGRGCGCGRIKNWNQQLFAVDGCRVHANCHPKDAKHVPPALELKFLTELICMRDASGQSSSAKPSPGQPNPTQPPTSIHTFLSLFLRCCPNVFAGKRKREQNSDYRSICHLALRAAPEAPSHRMPHLRTTDPPSHHPMPKVATAIHFVLLNFQKTTSKNWHHFVDSGSVLRG